MWDTDPPKAPTTFSGDMFGIGVAAKAPEASASSDESIVTGIMTRLARTTREVFCLED